MKILFGLFLFFIFTGFIFGQSSITEIDSFKKVYISTDDSSSRKIIAKELKKQKFTIVSDEKDAEFFIEYKVLSKQGTFGSRDGYEERGEMSVYFFKDEKKIVAWSDTETYSQASGMTFESPNERSLVKRFIKALRRK